jgi:hypothetical protein
MSTYAILPSDTAHNCLVDIYRHLQEYNPPLLCLYLPTTPYVGFAIKSDKRCGYQKA